MGYYDKAQMQTVIEKLPNITYIGLSAPSVLFDDSKRLIKRIYKQGNLTTIKFAEGTAAFDKSWNKRMSYIY